MSRGNFNIPYPVNEPVLSYAPGTAEREEVLRVYREMYSQAPIDVPMYIGKDAVRTDDKRTMSPPHDHQHILGHFNYGDASHVNAAIDAASPLDHRGLPFHGMNVRRCFSRQRI